jgi:hypothetical protein
VVEVFLGTDLQNIRHYSEFELAPTNERLDVTIKQPQKDFLWDSHFESAVTVDKKARRWHAELRIPMASLSDTLPAPGTKWRLNLFRSDRAQKAFLAWNPPLALTTHIPERFGVLEFTR